MDTDRLLLSPYVLVEVPFNYVMIVRRTFQLSECTFR